MSAKAISERDSSQCRILVVDDNVDSAETLAKLLRLHGHSVTVAFDGRAALDETRAKRPDVVILDPPRSGMVDKARAEAERVISTLMPYVERGVPVVGAWRWLPDRNFGVATKMDATEAFRPLQVLRSIFIVLVLLIALVTAATLVSTYWSLVWRGRFDAARLKALQLGQYTLQEKIGAGGMGVVYRARHALLRRETAIKLLLPEHADTGLIQQFEREVQLTCGLSHPNTIQIYDYGHTADGIFYYVMELLRGLTLQELVERFGAQPEERVIHILTQICGSLQEAHAAGGGARRGAAPSPSVSPSGGIVSHCRFATTVSA